ncbi:MAG: hypothetical protein ACK4VI_08300 [Alphaproteobacteria bacterium]
MKNKLFLIVFALCLLVGAFAPIPSAAQSDSSVLFVAPNRLVIAPNENTTEINVSNKSDVQRRYDITIVDQIMTGDGLTQRVDTFEYSAKRMLRFVPRRFTLEPGGRQVVRVMATRESGLPDGDYHSHILFREVPLAIQDRKEVEEQRSESSVQFEIRALYGIAVPIIVQAGNVVSDIDIGDVSFVPASEGTQAHLAVELIRTGNAEASGSLITRLSKGDLQDHQIAQNWIPIYREVDRVVRRIPLTSLPQGVTLQGGRVTLELTKDNRVTESGAPEVVTREITF